MFKDVSANSTLPSPSFGVPLVVLLGKHRNLPLSFANDAILKSASNLFSRDLMLA